MQLLIPFDDVFLYCSFTVRTAQYRWKFVLDYCQKKNVDDKDAMDYEGLYIYEGYLNYFIFNPTPYGTGSSRGGHVKTDSISKCRV
jgi:hypothetical protein